MTFLTGKSLSFLVGFGLIISSLSAFAEGLSTYSVQPMVASIKLEERQTLSFVLTNHSQDSITVGIDVFERIDKNGAELRLKTTDLVLDKSVLEMAPAESVTVNADYRGKKSLATERSFRIVTKQLSSAAAGAGVESDLRFSYEASVFFSLKNMSPDVTAKVRALPALGSIEVELENRGTAHQALSEVSFVVSDAKSPGHEKPLQLSSATRDLIGKQVLLARSKKRLVLQLASSSIPISRTTLISVRPNR